MKLVVGLGNPGSEYVGTRHNVGWEAIDRLAQRWGWISRSGEFEKVARSKFDGLAMDGVVSVHSGGTEKVLLLKPTTYMNLSGRSVQAAMGFYQVPPTEVIVVLDDLALPCGKLRIRANGSSGGHNGLKDIERMLGTSEYPRLRIGIDAPPPPIAGKDYVLGRFSSEQRQKIEPALDRSAAAIITWIEEGITPAMNRFNADESE
ncbi:MAG TPA: aminoacyl-tRNA hydrolase [Tepidisphaeraceae bacterium]|nr:aminoacyl-tRNA hydrolase [Tepidisphaeraceae bacterium]